MPENTIRIGRHTPKARLDRLVTQKVTEILNAMLDAEADEIAGGVQIRAFRRTEGVSCTGTPTCSGLAARWRKRAGHRALDGHDQKCATFRELQGADVFLETERKDYHMSGPEERQRAVDLYSTTPMTTAQVVEHLGYPTRQCLERWPARDPRYAGHMAKPIIPPETRTKAIELVLGGMRGSRLDWQRCVGRFLRGRVPVR